MTLRVQDLAKKIETAFVTADLVHGDDDGLLGYRHLALLAAVVALEEGLIPIQ